MFFPFFFPPPFYKLEFPPPLLPPFSSGKLVDFSRGTKSRFPPSLFSPVTCKSKTPFSPPSPPRAGFHPDSFAQLETPTSFFFFPKGAEEAPFPPLFLKIHPPLPFGLLPPFFFSLDERWWGRNFSSSPRSYRLCRTSPPFFFFFSPRWCLRSFFFFPFSPLRIL